MPWLQGADPLLVGIAGRAGSGKSTAADYLEAAYDFQPMAWAEPIKDLLEQLFLDRGIDHAHLHEPHLKTEPIAAMYGLSARQLMQRAGDWGRSIDADYWVHQLAHRMGMAAARPCDWHPIHDRIVIADVRYSNEAQWIVEAGGVIVRLHRDQAGPAGTHSSESQVDQLAVHVDLVNNGPTLTGLHALLDGVMDSIGAERRWCRGGV
jgi:hypothetical protein